MSKKKLLILCLGTASSLAALPPTLMDYPFEQVMPETIVINNRILLKIEGKAVTIMDVVRKMDLFFYRQYPELAASIPARYQFYKNSWRTILGAVIDDYLIMADAEERGVKVNDGEVREELELLFGPDVVVNLDQLGMTLTEAFDLLKTELTVQRMTSAMVHSKALADVHPTSVKKRYEKILIDTPSQDYWVYRILSIRGEKHEQVAQEAYRLMNEQKIPFEEIGTALTAENVEITYSDSYKQKESDLSLAYRAVLDTLGLETISVPISNEKVSRIFYLQEKDKIEPPTFNEVADRLKGELTQQAYERYNLEYRQKLRKKYGLTDQYLCEVIPGNLEPFALR
jgi:hypothetical protein